MALKVNEKSTAVLAMEEDLRKVDALMGGTRAMRAEATKYLPQWPREEKKSYEFRLATSTLYNAFSRTVQNMAGKPFTEPLKWSGIEPTVEGWFDNIDQCGQNLHVFAQEIFRAALKDGITHVLVDFPHTRGSDGEIVLRTKADEVRAGVRPYAIHVKQTQILGWISDSSHGADVLTQLRIMERVSVPDGGEFGMTEIDQVRVLEPGRWATYRVNANKEWDLHQEGETTLDFIPLVTLYTRRTGFMTAVPPLNDLADLNIKHWQSQSDQDSIVHVARVPILAIIGADNASEVDGEEKIEVGLKSAMMLPKGSDAKYVEHSGKAIDAGRASLKDLEAQMESMGAELLIARPGDKSATEAALDSAQEQSQLSSMAQALEDFLDQMVDMMARWAGLSDQGDIDVFDDFASIGLDAMSVGPFVNALVLIVNAGLMSRETAFAEMQRYSIINPDLIWKDEQERVKTSWQPPVSETVGS